MTRNAYTPLDVHCPLCHALPGRRCASVVISSRPALRRPHADRVTAARQATDRASAPRAPAHVTDAWTCPTCSRSYWAPNEWEPELWPVVRTAAQRMHGARHTREMADATQHPDPEPVEEDP